MNDNKMKDKIHQIKQEKVTQSTLGDAILTNHLVPRCVKKFFNKNFIAQYNYTVHHLNDEKKTYSIRHKFLANFVKIAHEPLDLQSELVSRDAPHCSPVRIQQVSFVFFFAKNIFFLQ